MPRIKINGISIDMPYEPYPAQIVSMSKIITCLQSKSSGLVESPTGTGKSLSILCSALGYCESFKHTVESQEVKRPKEAGIKVEETTQIKPKIIICSRTHKQLDQLIDQLKKTRYRPRISVLASRTQYCISHKLTEFADKNTGCNNLVKVGGCIYFSGKDRLAKRMGDRLFDIEEIKVEGKKCGGCPYYTSRILNSSADVIFAPYNYLIDPKIRESTGISLENSIIIIDEAHNIEDVCRSSGSLELTSKIVEIIQNELLNATKKSSMLGDVKMDFLNLMDLFRLIKTYAQNVKDFDRSLYTGKLKISKGIQIRETLDSIGLTKEYSLKFKNSLSAVRKHEEAKDLLNVNTFHILEGIDSVITSIHFTGCEAYGFVFQKHPDENYRNTTKVNFTLSIWLFDGAYIFRSFVSKVHSLVLLSGTLSPFNSFSSELGHEFAHSAIAPHSIRKEQLFVSCIKKGHLEKDLIGTYKTADTYPYLDQLAKIIFDTASKVKNHGGTLVFVPSYSFLENLSKRLALLRPQNMFTEPKNGGVNEFNNVMKKYKSSLQLQKGSILLCVYRGKASEGMDFKDSYARAVIAIGIPYPSLHDPQVELKKEYNDKHKKFNGRLWYETQAFRAVNQALGRVIRHSNDWGIILLLDGRYAEKRVQGHISSWVAENITINERYIDAIPQIDEFVKSKEKK